MPELHNRKHYPMTTVLNRLSNLALAIFAIGLFTDCEQTQPEIKVDTGIFLPDGFEAVVVVDSIKERVRHLAVREDGVIYAKLQNSDEHGSLVALKDIDGDIRADTITKFAGFYEGTEDSYATEARIHDGYLYYSSELVVYRIKLDAEHLVPQGNPEVILTDDHPHGGHEHIQKPLAFDDKGNMYVPFGAPSNSCQEPKRTPGAPGLDPCPQLENHGGIWKFDANKLNQTQKDGVRYATGIRSVTAMAWNPADKNLYIAMHGRDNLKRLFREKFDPWQSALLPSEEFIMITEGSNFGWPYCYYDQMQGKNVLAPEYGGDGQLVGRCQEFDTPEYGFPGHWAPNDLIFYDGDQFPERYKNGAFIAFHGSTDRAPYPQSGYIVAFLPFKGGKPLGEYEVFADGFAIVDPIISVNDALRRPMGLAIGPDGEMYISDSVKGAIWKIVFKGNKNGFGEDQLAAMEKRKLLTHLRTPDRVNDNLMPDNVIGGELVYQEYCAACHQTNGKGASGRFPPLVKNDRVRGDKVRLIKILLNGMEGGLTIDGITYNGLMPQHSFLKDKEIADVLSYVRASFGNHKSAITPKEVEEIRAKEEKSGIKIKPVRADAVL